MSDSQYDPDEASFEYEVTYHYGGHQWRVTIYARDRDEVEARLRNIALAREIEGPILGKISGAVPVSLISALLPASWMNALLSWRFGAEERRVERARHAGRRM